MHPSQESRSIPAVPSGGGGVTNLGAQCTVPKWRWTSPQRTKCLFSATPTLAKLASYIVSATSVTTTPTSPPLALTLSKRLSISMGSPSSCKSGIPPARSAFAPLQLPTTEVRWVYYCCTMLPTWNRLITSLIGYKTSKKMLPPTSSRS